MKINKKIQFSYNLQQQQQVNNNNIFEFICVKWASNNFAGYLHLNATLIIVKWYTEFGTERRLVFDIYRVEHGLGEAQIAQINSTTAVIHWHRQHGKNAPFGLDGRALGNWINGEDTGLAVLQVLDEGAVPGLAVQAAVYTVKDQVNGCDCAELVNALDVCARRRFR